MGELRMVKKL